MHVFHDAVLVSPSPNHLYRPPYRSRTQACHDRVARSLRPHDHIPQTRHLEVFPTSHRITARDPEVDSAVNLRKIDKNPSRPPPESPRRREVHRKHRNLRHRRRRRSEDETIS